MRRAAFGLVVSTLCLGLVGCGSDDTGGGTTAATSTSGAGATGGGGSGSGATGSGGMTASSASTGVGGGTGGTGGSAAAPTITMTVDPDTISAGGTTTATVMVTNFILQPPGGANEPGHGHYHIYLDKASGGNYLVADQVPMVTVKIPAATAIGPHTLRVSVSDNNHAPLVPAVEDVVDITVV
jgi:hypothetical protein